MRYEVVESPDGWVVRRDGVEVACFACQSEALEEVARRLQGAGPQSGAVSLAMHFQRRAG